MGGGHIPKYRIGITEGRGNVFDFLWSNIVQILYKCFVFTGIAYLIVNDLYHVTQTSAPCRLFRIEPSTGLVKCQACEQAQTSEEVLF